MTVEVTKTGCTNPALAELATAYSFGDATDREARAFEHHLHECDVCWARAQRLGAAVRTLRADRRLAQTLAVHEVAGLMGMSAALDQPFGGHRRHALLGSALYASLYAVPVLVEVAYQWDRYARGALLTAPVVFAWVFASTLFALAACARAVRTHGLGFFRSLLLMAGATVLLCAALAPFSPAGRTVEATFTTYPVALGYLKSVVYAWSVGPVFLLWPFYFVLILQRHLATGRSREVYSLLTEAPEALPPRGVNMPRVWALMLYLAGLFVFNWVGVAHLFDALVDGPYTSLFMTFVMTRAALWMLLPIVCLWWYQGCLNELKRECMAVIAFTERDSQGEAGIAR